MSDRQDTPYHQTASAMAKGFVEKYAGTSGKLRRKASGEEYQAYSRIEGRQLRLQIRKGDGYSRAPSYSYIMDVHQSPMISKITLICTTGTITIEGDHLDELGELLLDEKVRWIQEWDKGRFGKPEEGQPCIRKISFEDVFKAGH